MFIHISKPLNGCTKQLAGLTLKAWSYPQGKVTPDAPLG